MLIYIIYRARERLDFPAQTPDDEAVLVIYTLHLLTILS